MLSDDDQARDYIRRQATADALSFAAQPIDDDAGSGIPPPPQIKVTEVSSQAYEFDAITLGQQGAGTQPAPFSPPPPPSPTGACCDGPDCTIESQGQCESHGGTYQGDGSPCDPNPCEGCPTCDDAFGVDPIYVTLSDVALCPCIDAGDDTWFSMVDGHFPGGTDTGVNSEWSAAADFSNHWQGFTSNLTPDDPYCFPLSYDNGSCTGTPVGVNTDSCIINVTCNFDDTWTITIEHSGWGFIFQGTGCGTVDDPILNEFTFEDCGTTIGGKLVTGYGGQAVISFSP